MENTNIERDIIITPNEETKLDEATAKINIRVRRKTSFQWSSLMEVIPLGEPCFSIDTGELRIGDGVNVWNNLQSSSGINPDLYVVESITD
jgi:hypothetical protein